MKNKKDFYCIWRDTQEVLRELPTKQPDHLFGAWVRIPLSPPHIAGCCSGSKRAS